MKNPTLTIIMNTMLATQISAQVIAPITPNSNWLAAHREVLGANVPATWLMDIDADEMEIHVTPSHALIIVDRAPIIDQGGAAYLRNGMNGLGGTHLTLVGEVQTMNESVMRGTYSGLLGGCAVLMDQYVQLRNGVPTVVVRVITRVNGSVPVIAFDQDEFVAELLGDDVQGVPALTRK